MCWSRKHAQQGGDLQALTRPDGHPEWVSPVRPGTERDNVTGRAHVLPMLYPAATAGLPIWCDKSCKEAEVSIIVPFNGSYPNADTVSRSAAINALRA